MFFYVLIWFANCAAYEQTFEGYSILRQDEEF